MAKRRPVACLVLLVSSVGIAFLLAEGLLRVLGKLEQAEIKYRDVVGDPLHQWDPMLGWRTVPGTRATVQSLEYKVSVHNNSRGIRGPEYSYTPGRNEYRILVIGDSFTAGYTVPFEDTFGQIMERELNAQASHQYTVIAVGTEAYSTDQELLYFVEEGWKYHPAITVLMFFFNDVWFNTQRIGGADFGSKPVFQIDGKKLVLAHKPISNSDRVASNQNVRLLEPDTTDVSAGLTVRRWLNAHSHLYRLVWRAAKEGIRRKKIPLRSMWFTHPLFDSLRVFKTSYDDDIGRAWSLTEALITQLANEVEQQGSRFLLFYIPERASVYDHEWNMAKIYQTVNDTEWRPDQVEVELRRMCAEHHLDCILPTTEFREQAAKVAPKRLYFVKDFHWTREGHEVAGKLLAEYVQRR